MFNKILYFCKNFKLNNMIKKLLFAIIIALFSGSLFSQNVLITEIADGTAPGGYPKFVEITNLGSMAVDLNGYKVVKSANGGGFAAAYTFTNTFNLPAGSSMVVTNIDSVNQFWGDYNLPTPTYCIYGATNVNGNGDDAYGLADPTDSVIDIYGEELIDGTGTPWEYMDSYAYRNSNVTNANPTFTISEWTIAAPNTLDNEYADLSSYLTPGYFTITPPDTNAAYITSFSFVEETAPATIDTAAKTIDIEVANGTNLSSIVPTFTVSTGANANPASGIAQDFSSTFHYTITSQSGLYVNDWTVNVTLAPASNDAYIISFNLAQQTSPAVIDTAAKTVNIEVTSGTSVSALNPSIIVSGGATISPNGTQDFSSPVTYTVTSESGLVVNYWTATVTVAQAAPTVSIFDIQGQVSASPYDSIVVQTGGVVTAKSSLGYWIQNTGSTSAWSGLYVFDDVNNPTVGDSIFVEGLIIEHNGLTELKSVSSFQSFTTTRFPQETVVLTADAGEQYESVLIKVESVICTNQNAGYGMFTVNNGAIGDTLLIDDVIYHYTATAGSYYDIAGVLYFSYNEFKILPRDSNDIYLYVGINNSKIEKVKIYPNPSIDEINVKNANNISKVVLFDELGNQVLTIDNINTNLIKLPTTCLRSGLYFINVYDNNNKIIKTKFIKK